MQIKVNWLDDLKLTAFHMLNRQRFWKGTLVLNMVWSSLLYWACCQPVFSYEHSVTNHQQSLVIGILWSTVFGPVYSVIDSLWSWAFCDQHSLVMEIQGSTDFGHENLVINSHWSWTFCDQQYLVLHILWSAVFGSEHSVFNRLWFWTFCDQHSLVLNMLRSTLFVLNNLSSQFLWS